MAKFCGVIGFAVTEETKPGVWTNKITEREYCGDTIKPRRALQNANQVNDNINIADQISIMADDYAIENSYAMRYVVYLGSKWKISTVSSERPRLILTLGGLFNGQ
jgi:hypothetical protein